MSRRVVVFSCDPIRGNVTVRRLRREGFDVSLHGSAGEAVGAAAAAPPDVLVFDTVDAMPMELDLLARHGQPLARRGVRLLLLGERAALLPRDACPQALVLPGQLDPEEIVGIVAASQPPPMAGQDEPPAAAPALPQAAAEPPAPTADAARLEADLLGFLGLASPKEHP